MSDLGDEIERALRLVGITEERVSQWLGKPCQCSRRKRKLNKLSRWARERVNRTLEESRTLIRRMLGERLPKK